MVNLLRRLFIKDYKNVNNKKVREGHGILASIVGIIANLVLFAIKLIIGILSLSTSIISDAINNLTDLFSCVVNLIGFKVASKPADEDHPFGHERIEYISGMIISLVIIAVAFLLGYTSVNKLINHDANTNFELVSFIILGISIVFKLLLGLFYRSIGKIINSVSLKAAMQDSINDCICTGLVLICAIIQSQVPSLWWLDPAISIGLAVFILYSGIKMVKDTADPLIGISPDSDFVKAIVNDVLSHKGALGVHDITCHCYGPTKTFVTLHVEVDGYQNVMELHDMIDNIEQKISNKYSCEITIHMDPIDTKNEEIPVIKEEIRKCLKEIDEKISFHDLRVVAGPTHTNVLFDVVVPNSCKVSEEIINSKLSSQIKLLNKKYIVKPKIETSYCK